MADKGAPNTLETPVSSADVSRAAEFFPPCHIVELVTKPKEEKQGC